jgi:hypothetical protein
MTGMGLCTVRLHLRASSSTPLGAHKSKRLQNTVRRCRGWSPALYVHHPVLSFLPFQFGSFCRCKTFRDLQKGSSAIVLAPCMRCVVNRCGFATCGVNPALCISAGRLPYDTALAPDPALRNLLLTLPQRKFVSQNRKTPLSPLYRLPTFMSKAPPRFAGCGTKTVRHFIFRWRAFCRHTTSCCHLYDRSPSC